MASLADFSSWEDPFSLVSKVRLTSIPKSVWERRFSKLRFTSSPTQEISVGSCFGRLWSPKHEPTPILGHAHQWKGGGLGDGGSEKAVSYEGSISVLSHDLAPGVDPVGKGYGRAGHVERGVDALVEPRNRVEQEAVYSAGSIKVHSHDLAQVVDPVERGIGRAGHVEPGVDALVEQEAVLYAGSINVESHDLAPVVDPVGKCTTGCAGHVERGVDALVEQERVLCEERRKQ